MGFAVVAVEFFVTFRWTHWQLFHKFSKSWCCCLLSLIKYFTHASPCVSVSVSWAQWLCKFWFLSTPSLLHSSCLGWSFVFFSRCFSRWCDFLPDWCMCSPSADLLRSSGNVIFAKLPNSKLVGCLWFFNSATFYKLLLLRAFSRHIFFSFQIYDLS